MSRCLKCRECGERWGSGRGTQPQFRLAHIERHGWEPPWPKGGETTFDTWKPAWDKFMTEHFETEKEEKQGD